MTLILETSPNQTALEILREKYEREPHSKLFMPLAEQLRVGGSYGEAIELCTRGKALHPRYVSCRVLLGKCLMELGMREEAHRELEEVLELDRENVFSLRVVGEILRAQGKLTEAADYYRAVLRINPADMDAQERLTVITRFAESSEDDEPRPFESYADVRFDRPEEPSVERVELDASDASSTVPRDGKAPSRGSVQFFNYEVKHSDFSRFTEWVSKVSRESSGEQGSKEHSHNQE